VKMPISITTFYEDAPESCDPAKLMAEGKLDRAAVIASARRILKLMAKLD